jgi:hypothetical protein
MFTRYSEKSIHEMHIFPCVIYAQIDIFYEHDEKLCMAKYS